MRFDEEKEPSYLGWLFLISMILQVLLSLFASLLDQKGITFPVELALVVSEFTILAPTLVYILAGNLRFKEDLGFRPVKIGTVIMSLVLVVFVTPIASFFNVLSQLFVSNTMVQVSDTLTEGSSVAVILLGSVYGPFCEELTFRSVFAGRYEKYTGPMTAAVVSALYFALAHMNVNQAMYAFALGWIFAVINRAARSVYPSLIIHACINFGNLLMLFVTSFMYKKLGIDMDLAQSSEAARNSEVIYTMVALFLVIAIVCTAIAIPCVVFIAKHEGGHEVLYEMFTKKHDKKKWLCFPAVLGIALVLFVMFGLKPVLAAFGG